MLTVPVRRLLPTTTIIDPDWMTMIESFFSEIDWTTAAMLVGLMVSITAAIFFGHRRS